MFARSVRFRPCLLFPALQAAVVTAGLWSAAAHADLAAATRVLVDEGYAAFARGTLEDVSLSSEGLLEAAPTLTEVALLDVAEVWDVALHPDGGLVLSGGQQGQLWQLSEDGSVKERLLDVDQPLLRAVAIADNGDIYAGSSPQGAVYRIRGDTGAVELWHDPETEFIWDLAWQGDALWMVTGQPARLDRIPIADDGSAGEPELWWAPREEHLNLLVPNGDEGWLVTAYPGAVLYAVTGPQEGRALVDVDAVEVTDLKVRDGALWFTALEPRRGNNNRREGRSGSPGPGNSGANRAQRLQGGEDDGLVGRLYRWEPEQGAEPYWPQGNSSPQGLYALTGLGEAFWLVGGATEGRLYAVESRDRWSVVQQAGRGGSVSHVLPAQTGYWMVTSRPGAVYRLGGHDSPPGRFTSEVGDAEAPAQWGQFELLTVGTVALEALETRSGWTETPDATWSDWEAVALTEHAGALRGAVESPQGRFIQYRWRFAETASTGGVRRARLFYALPNQAPVLHQLAVVPVGLEARANPANPPAVDFEQLWQERVRDGFLGAMPERLQVRRLSGEHALSVLWRASDPDGDALRYRVALRREDKAEDEGADWVTVADGLELPLYSFTTQGWAEGWYQVRVEASDAPARAPEVARSTERVSGLVLVDHSAPTITVLTRERQDDGGWLIRLRVEDGLSPLKRVHYRVDGGHTQPLSAEDGLLDSPKEHFELRLRPSGTAPRDLIFEATDEADRTATLPLRLN